MWGQRCRSAPIQDVARKLHLDWHMVKALERHYTAAQLARACYWTPHPGNHVLDKRYGQNAVGIVLNDVSNAISGSLRLSDSVPANGVFLEKL